MEDADAALARELAEAWDREEAAREEQDAALARELAAQWGAEAHHQARGDNLDSDNNNDDNDDEDSGNEVKISEMEDDAEALEGLCARLQQELEDAATAQEIQRQEEDEAVAQRLHREWNASHDEAAQREQENEDLWLAKKLHEQLNVVKRESNSFADVVKRKNEMLDAENPDLITYMGSGVDSHSAKAAMPRQMRTARRSSLTTRKPMGMSVQELTEELRITRAKASLAHARSLRVTALSKFSRLHLMEPGARGHHQAQADEAMSEAASLVFAHNNAELARAVLTRSRGLRQVKVDFHYLILREALDRLEAILQISTTLSWGTIDIICGAGFNSTNNRARIGPCIRQRLEELRKQRIYVRRFQDHGQGNFEVEILQREH
mmetsp:Transcript_68/g.231  ORF Transcript_68/g.231 Transcript_68/m.231 type:complete len:380 (+) Transcript_68:49-1188(+)